MRRWTLGAVGFALTTAVVATVLRTTPREEIDLASVERAAAHYAQAERELAAADVGDLPAARRAARAKILDELRAYRNARDFGRNSESEDLRAHLFVDEDGRRCAVAQLLHRTGEDDLVADVASSLNGAFVADLADDARFLGWLDRSGLSLEEAARIQAPAIQTPSGEIGGTPTTGTPTTETGTPTTQTGEPAPEAPGRPADTGTPGGGDPGTGGPTTGSGNGPGPGGPPASGGGVGRGARTGGGPASNRPLAGVGAEAWWMWWEFEKLTWMRPARDRLEPTPATAGYDPVADLAARRADAVEKLLPLLKHQDPTVRGAAAIAAARLGRGAVVDAILPLLADEKMAVRDRAILALGATGDARAAEKLLAIAQSAPDAAPTAWARQLAVVALGVARRHALKDDPGADIAALLDRAKARNEESLADAAAMYAALARSEAVVRRLQDVADEPAVHAAIRGRALEALPPRTDATTVRILQKALGGRDADVRRASAVALGGVKSPLVAPFLMTAAELETDGLTRGLLLVSMARQGGARSEGFLASALADRDMSVRPWAALGMALLARDHRSDAAYAALGKAEVRSTDQGSLWLARALAGDDKVAAECIDALDDRDPRRRASAAAALTLVPGDEAAAALRAHAVEEAEDAPAVALLLAVGLRGDAQDSALLLAAGRKHRPDWAQAPVAMALGLHRARGTVDGLVTILSSPRSSARQIAVAADAIGIALDEVPEPSLPAIGRRTNFAAIPDWLLAALRSTL